jgi:hypothetical protein
LAYFGVVAGFGVAAVGFFAAVDAGFAVAPAFWIVM